MPFSNEIDLPMALNCVYTDFLMLRDGDWDPDEDTINASIGMIERIAEILDIGLEDTREDME